ncbi:MAG: tRNA guanosine(34) transglycosylase Tgt [Deltaproteobacteria bacterium]|nr:tRNA guanosine(34) transglycosylase Tgt [Deltaproteobacteria bacterium]
MTEGFSFNIQSTDGNARKGLITTPNGNIPTPAFMPVGTRASVKALSPDDIRNSGASILLGNTYHLMLRPGEELIKNAGGLAKFMAWNAPTLTDSGGFQVFSLSDRVKIDDLGVKFSSHIDGAKIFLTPQKAIQIQRDLGSDIAMVLDVCPPGDAHPKEIRRAMELTSKWAKIQIECERKTGQALFGIVQGGTDETLRRDHLSEISDIPFDGIALGGLSVGEPTEDMYRIFHEIAPLMPKERPRYVMGVGTPGDLLEAIEQGVDIFDCVMPTRNARNGQAFVRGGKLNIKGAKFSNDSNPLDSKCNCYTCRTFERRYLRHLFTSGELLIHRLLSIHNLTHYGDMMQGAREAITQGTFNNFKKEWLTPVESLW